jgi:hypothetical protein
MDVRRLRSTDTFQFESLEELKEKANTRSDGIHGNYSFKFLPLAVLKKNIETLFNEVEEKANHSDREKMTALLSFVEQLGKQFTHILTQYPGPTTIGRAYEQNVGIVKFYADAITFLNNNTTVDPVLKKSVEQSMEYKKNALYKINKALFKGNEETIENIDHDLLTEELQSMILTGMYLVSIKEAIESEPYTLSRCWYGIQNPLHQKANCILGETDENPLDEASAKGAIAAYQQYKKAIQGFRETTKAIQESSSVRILKKIKVKEKVIQSTIKDVPPEQALEYLVKQQKYYPDDREKAAKRWHGVAEEYSLPAFTQSTLNQFAVKKSGNSLNIIDDYKAEEPFTNRKTF